MKTRIQSKKLGKTIVFSRPGDAYIYADLNGGQGSLGLQICIGGRLTGSTISYSGDDENEFARICRVWYRAYLRMESAQ